MDTFDCTRIFVGEILGDAKSGVVKICLSDQAQLKSLATRTWLIKGELCEECAHSPEPVQIFMVVQYFITD